MSSELLMDYWKDTNNYLDKVGRYGLAKMPPLIVTCAITGGNQGKEANPGLPETLEEQVQQTYDAYNAATDAYAAATDGTNGSSIAMKLLGKKYDSGTGVFSGVPVTIRYVIDPASRIAVFMKLAEQGEDAFQMVSVQDPAGDATASFGTWNANAICVKIGGTQNGYIDNIAVWTGTGNYPQPEPEPEEPVAPEEGTTEPSEETGEEPDGEEESEPEEPKKVKEPQTIVNKIAVWAVALFGGWIIVKKGKEEKQ